LASGSSADAFNEVKLGTPVQRSLTVFVFIEISRLYLDLMNSEALQILVIVSATMSFIFSVTGLPQNLKQ